MNELNNNKAQRLSKLQKWILINAYNKTVLFDNSGLTLLDSYDYHRMDYSESYRTELKKGIEDKQHMYWKYLFRSEILLDYFKRETDKGKASGLQSLHRFKGKGNNEQVILTNSLSNLYDKELITIYDGECTRWQGILLTAKGIDIAKLLKVKI